MYLYLVLSITSGLLLVLAIVIARLMVQKYRAVREAKFYSSHNDSTIPHGEYAKFVMFRISENYSERLKMHKDCGWNEFPKKWKESLNNIIFLNFRNFKIIIIITIICNFYLNCFDGSFFIIIIIIFEPPNIY